MPIDDPGVSLVSLLLADYANVREGLLNVVSAGITRVAPRGDYPFHPDVFLAMMVYVNPDRIDQTHESRVTVKYPETAEKIAQIDFTFNAQAARFPWRSRCIGRTQWPIRKLVDVLVTRAGSRRLSAPRCTLLGYGNKP